MTITNDHDVITKIAQSHNHVINTQEIWSATKIEIDIDQIVDDLSVTIKGVKLSDPTQDKPLTDKEEAESFRKKLTSTNSFSPTFKNINEKESSVEETIS